MARAQLLLVLALVTVVTAWAPPARVRWAIQAVKRARPKGDVDSGGGTELAYETEDDAQNLFAVQREYSALAARVTKVLRGKAGGVAVSTEGKTWVTLQVEKHSTMLRL
jgi:hypothetical protein